MDDFVGSTPLHLHLRREAIVEAQGELRSGYYWAERNLDLKTYGAWCVRLTVGGPPCQNRF